MKNDRSVAGAISGAIGAVVQQFYAVVIRYMGISDKHFGDFAGIIVMYKKYEGFVAHIIQWSAHLAVGMLFGIIFAQIFRYMSSRYWWLKGIVYGLILWFLLTGVGTLFKMPMWTIISPRTALTLLIGSLIYGAATAYTLKVLDKRTDLI
ncbi:MAG: DUF6789 family protein [Eubacteriales bacterium]